MLKVRPGASRPGWDGVFGDRLKVSVTGPAHEGKANKSLVDFVAKTLGCPKRDITLTAGHKSRDKTLKLTGRAVKSGLKFFKSI